MQHRVSLWTFVISNVKLYRTAPHPLLSLVLMSKSQLHGVSVWGRQGMKHFRELHESQNLLQKIFVLLHVCYLQKPKRCVLFSFLSLFLFSPFFLEIIACKMRANTQSQLVVKVIVALTAPVMLMYYYVSKVTVLQSYIIKFERAIFDSDQPLSCPPCT